MSSTGKKQTPSKGFLYLDPDPSHPEEFVRLSRKSRAEGKGLPENRRFKRPKSSPVPKSQPAKK